MPTSGIRPYRGKLVSALAAPDRRLELKRAAETWPSWDLTPLQLADLELLLSGALSPVTQYLDRSNYQRVLSEMRLSDGTLWPWPITLDVSEEFAAAVDAGTQVALRDPEGVMLAALEIVDLWRPDREQELAQLYGTTDREHGGVARRVEHRHPVYLAGRLEGCQLPIHYDFRMLRTTPAELRDQLTRRGWRRVLAYEATEPIHRAAHEQIYRSSREHETNILLSPAVGRADSSDRRYFSTIRSIQATLPHFPHNTALLNLQPSFVRHSPLRETLLRAIIHQNFGCSHLLLDPAQSRAASAHLASADTIPSDEALAPYRDELEITIVRAKRLVYVKELMDFYVADELPAEAFPLRFSHADLAARLSEGKPIPAWFSFPEVVAELKRTNLPRAKQGFTVFFTGLSGAGKSTIANVLLVRLLEMGGRPVTLLDGDIVRKHLSSELSFSKEHRDINIRRIGFVASKITKNGGIAICAPIAPYDSLRREVRAMIAAEGGFILVHVATPLGVCESRDRKGVYAKARAGIIKEFTGISDPYEVPEDADVVIDTAELTPVHSAQQVLLHLKKMGYLGMDEGDGV